MSHTPPTSLPSPFFLLHPILTSIAGYMARLARRPHPRLHSPGIRRLQRHLPVIPLLDQDPTRRMEIRVQPGGLGHRRHGQEQLFLGLDDSEPRSRELCAPARDYRAACGRAAQWRAGVSAVREYSGLGQWDGETEWRCAGDELLQGDGSWHPIQPLHQVRWIHDSGAGVDEVGEA